MDENERRTQFLREMDEEDRIQHQMPFELGYGSDYSVTFRDRRQNGSTVIWKLTPAGWNAYDEKIDQWMMSTYKYTVPTDSDRIRAMAIEVIVAPPLPISEKPKN